jgi:coenzyme Q-binding protein COQ10
MPTHAEQRRLPYTPKQMFDLVADVEKYPEFLPWCVGLRVNSREGDVILADMVIGYKMFQEKFTSEVRLQDPDQIDVAYRDGSLKHMRNHWKFLPDKDGGCIIDFYVDFEFRSMILQKMIGGVFHEAVKIMVHAFEKRAAEVYGVR